MRFASHHHHPRQRQNSGFVRSLPSHTDSLETIRSGDQMAVRRPRRLCTPYQLGAFDRLGQTHTSLVNKDRRRQQSPRKLRTNPSTISVTYCRRGTCFSQLNYWTTALVCRTQGQHRICRRKMDFEMLRLQISFPRAFKLYRTLSAK